MKVWQWQEGDGKKNFGDTLTKPIIEKAFGIDVQLAGREEAELYGVGSLLEMLEGHPSGVVWGSGFIRAGAPVEPKLDYRLVRGKLTRERLGLNSLPVGDPGLLADYLYDKMSTVEHEFGIFPHYVDANNPIIRELKSDPRVCILDAYEEAEATLAKIASCRIVYSSSLHGLVAADALCIPNARVKLSDKLTGGDYKFKDYYSAFDIPEYEQYVVAATVENLTDTKTAELIIEEYRRPGLEKIRQDILSAFPHDIV